MKLKSCFWHFALACMTAAMCAGITACSSDDPSPDPKPGTDPKPDPKDNGAVTFIVDIPKGSGDGSSYSPVVVKKGETLNMAVSQKSSYTDPDGSVYTCEPKAAIKLSATLDTVFAKDMAELTNVKGGSDIKTGKTGTSPVLNRTVQTFEVGGQKIVFDLSHEVYTYVNSEKDKIEMPYVKPNPAKFGSSGATEETPEGRSTAAVTGVTVRPLATSRAAVLRDSAMYAVNVRLSLDLESVNAKEESRQTVEFSVNYVGVVETVTELKDPVAELSYRWDAKGGTASTESPFVKTKGEPMEIWMVQTSSYTDEYGCKSTGKPVAKVRISAANDTVWAKSVDELKAFAEKEGGASSGQTALQKFGSALQSVDIEWSYESCEAPAGDGKTIPMPYYALKPVTLKDVSVKEISENETIGGKPAAVYEVTATFSQKAEAKNVTAETPEAGIEYVVSYVGAVRIITDPVAGLSYKWEVKGGTASAESPFVKAKGAPMEVWMSQTSTYTDEYGHEFTGKPVAKVKISAANDTVWAKSVDELKAFAEKEGGKSSGQTALQKFGSALQNVDMEWSYMRCEATREDSTIRLPYYALKPVKLKDVSVKEVSDGVDIGGKPATVYEVTATFSQKAVAEDIRTETPDVDIEYVVSYVGAVELKLVNVEYIPSGEWVDPHDNMPLAYYAKVERYRTYSNGKRVGPDVFYDRGHPARPYPGQDYIPGKKLYPGDEWRILYPYTETNVGDSIVIYTGSTQISRMHRIHYKKAMEEYTTDVLFKDWAGYGLSILESDSHSIAKDFDNPQYPKCDRPSGWYYNIFKYKCEYAKYWQPFEFDSEGNGYDWVFGPVKIVFDFHDQFLVIDGRRIDFSKLHNLRMNFSFIETDIADSHKEGKVAKLEMKASYLGKNFYSAHIDSVYVAK